eukprot:6554981-Pyramimonas_sp.AAC.1
MPRAGVDGRDPSGAVESGAHRGPFLGPSWSRRAREEAPKGPCRHPRVLCQAVPKRPGSPIALPNN